MKLSTPLTAIAVALTSASASSLAKRIDNRIPVTIPEGYNLTTFCAFWKGGCLATVALKQHGATASTYCQQAPPNAYPNAANVYCTTTPTTRYTNDVISELKLTAL